MLPTASASSPAWPSSSAATWRFVALLERSPPVVEERNHPYKGHYYLTLKMVILTVSEHSRRSNSPVVGMERSRTSFGSTAVEG